MDDAQGATPASERDVPEVIVPRPQVQSEPESGARPQAARPDPPADHPVPDWVGAPSADESTEKKDKDKEKHGSFLKELPILILIAFGLALLIKTFLLQAFYIPSESMVPTLQIGDRVLVNKLVYRIHPPRRGDIIVFIEHPGPKRSFWGRVRSFLTEGLGVTKPASKDFIKRVIGLPGDRLQITNGVVTITTSDGKTLTLDEPYLNTPRDTGSFGPTTVPASSYFVMGDNRGNSADSRTELGPISKSRIIGRAFIRIWPIGRFGFFHRPNYSNASAAGLMSMAPGLVLASAFVVRKRRLLLARE